MAVYETVFIARQELSTQQAKQICDKFTSILSDRESKIGRQEFWGLRSLAYMIKKNRKGYYFMFNHESKAPAIDEMRRQMRLSEDVLREMTLRLKAMPEEQSPMMGYRDRNEENASRGIDRSSIDKKISTVDTEKSLDTSAKDAHAGDTSAKDANAKDAHAEDANAKDTSAKDTSAEDAHVKDTSAKDANVKDAHVKDTSAEDANAEDAHVKDTSAEDANVKDTSAEDANAEDTSAEDTSAEDANAEESKEEPTS